MTRAGSGGFTLIEMLVVMVLISISVALVYPSMLELRDRFDGMLDAASAERNQKREVFVRFISGGLPQKAYSSATKQ